MTAPIDHGRIGLDAVVDRPGPELLEALAVDRDRGRGAPTTSEGTPEVVPVFFELVGEHRASSQRNRLLYKRSANDYACGNGSEKSLLERMFSGPVAQWSEQGTHNPSVAGSIPAGPTADFAGQTPEAIDGGARAGQRDKLFPVPRENESHSGLGGCRLPAPANGARWRAPRHKQVSRRAGTPGLRGGTVDDCQPASAIEVVPLQAF